MTDHEREKTVWIFHGDGAHFASGVFESEEQGLSWCLRHKLSGTLTQYEIGDGCYDIAVRNGSFHPSKQHHGSPSHVATFSPSLWHVHILNGLPLDDQDRSWLLNQGFRVEVRQEDGDLYWADLVSEATDQIAAPQYGRGVNVADAIRSARTRYETEQFGQPDTRV